MVNKTVCFLHGFRLDGDELRSFVDTSASRLKMLYPPGAKIAHGFDLQWRGRRESSGTIAHSLTDVLAHPNDRKQRLVRIRANITVRPKTKARVSKQATASSADRGSHLNGEFQAIIIEFVNADRCQVHPDRSPIVVQLSTDDAASSDWRRVTLEDLRKEVKKIRRTSLSWHLREPSRHLLYCVVLLTIGFVLGAYFALQFKSGLGNELNKTIVLIDHKDGSEHQDRRPDYQVAIAERREERFLIFLGFLVGPYGGLRLLAQFQFLFWPAYLFYWGEHAKIYDRRMRVLKNIFVYLLLALVTSVAANFVHTWIVNKYGR